MEGFDLNRFLQAQERDYEIALSEMRQGRKSSHWIWYIFPQEKGLGHRYNSKYYGLEGVEEASAYLSHLVLGQRLREITNAVLSHSDKYSILLIMSSSIDAKKFWSCMTIFDKVSPNDIFHEALVKFFPDKVYEQK